MQALSHKERGAIRSWFLDYGFTPASITIDKKTRVCRIWDSKGIRSAVVWRSVVQSLITKRIVRQEPTKFGEVIQISDRLLEEALRSGKHCPELEEMEGDNDYDTK